MPSWKTVLLKLSESDVIRLSLPVDIVILDIIQFSVIETAYTFNLLQKQTLMADKRLNILYFSYTLFTIVNR
jgi:hypothetical protein